ncbi:adenylate/guanylate cyclase domain-containing protein [Pricia sp. S334]|uniref:Adenylate/guanylate cyclase domain-containing protein n=1 Tax=Pricia mediterranea TaxID=3076079 RepID=A0ABU3L794_9FLAO|nr:adenylate/guanylate cyclase domain-containing protein [Pricia sp. S334]MDT7829567.1 adenylate/guanylate cyclase domain-containing protein [Pricia sp. S334]
MLSPKTKRNISRIIPYGVIWLVLGWVNLFSQEAVLTAALEENSAQSAVIRMTPTVFIFASIAVIVVGLLVGTIEVVWLGNLFGKKSFLRKIGYKLVFYTIFLLLIILICYPIAAALESRISLFDPIILDKLWNFLNNIEFTSTMVSISFSLFVSLFYSEISENIGHGVLMNFFTGKYHTPKEEKRIFLFSDMKSSTAIAERLGHIEYFELLRQYYSDFSDAIVRHSGEVYQYIGDEIVISWKYEDGIKNNNCINCFFAMKEALKKRADGYNNTFGVAPTFKAGLHVGMVTTGEIGALKKEIIFTGDVLNTTARIQALCNQYNVNLLVSEDLVNELESASKFQITSLGKNELRGKEENLELFTVRHKC